jgi:GTPase SAR1 family protein
MAISPGTYDMKIQRRSDHSVKATFTDKDTGAAINLTGYTIEGQVWDTARTAKAADITIAYTNRTSGIIDFSLTDTQTTTFTLNEYKYDLLFTNSAGLKEYWLEGSIYMSEGYTA